MSVKSRVRIQTNISDVMNLKKKNRKKNWISIQNKWKSRYEKFLTRKEEKSKLPKIIFLKITFFFFRWLFDPFAGRYRITINYLYSFLLCLFTCLYLCIYLFILFYLIINLVVIIILRFIFVLFFLCLFAYLYICIYIFTFFYFSFTYWIICLFVYCLRQTKITRNKIHGIYIIGTELELESKNNNI